MKTEQEITDEFLADLRALLAKYDAELNAEDHYPDWPEAGEDIRMTVSIPALYNVETGDKTRDHIDIDLGRFFKP